MRESAVRGFAATDCAEYVSGEAPLFLDGDWGHGRPERGGYGRRTGVVQDLLWAVECSDRDGRRYRREDRKGEGRKIVWEYSNRPPCRPSASLGGEDDRNAPASGAGSCSPGADLYGVEHS